MAHEFDFEFRDNEERAAVEANAHRARVAPRMRSLLSSRVASKTPAAAAAAAARASQEGDSSSTTTTTNSESLSMGRTRSARMKAKRAPSEQLSQRSSTTSHSGEASSRSGRSTGPASQASTKSTISSIPRSSQHSVATKSNATTTSKSLPTGSSQNSLASSITSVISNAAKSTESSPLTSSQGTPATSQQSEAMSQVSAVALQGSSTTPQSASISASSQGSMAAPPSRPPHKSKSNTKSRPALWLQDEEAVETQPPKSSALLPAVQQRPLQPRTLLGASRNVYADMDAGHYQKICDDVMFWAASMQSQPSPQAALELASLLGDKNDRKLLWNNNNSSTVEADDAPLMQVLQLLVLYKGEREATEKDNLRRVREHLCGMLHFVSLDCTVSPHASSSASTARNIRKAILTSPETMQGILRLVLSDPLTAAIRSKSKPGACGGNLVSPRRSSNKLLLGTFDSPSTVASNSVASTPESQTSIESGDDDPTKAGRIHRRKKRRVDLSLTTIPENSKVDSITMDSFQFSGSDVPSDGDGPAALTRAQQQLDTLTLRILRTRGPQGDGEGQAHLCGNQMDETFDPIPLVAVTRILTGKMEGSDDSCLDEDMECLLHNDQPEGEDEDESNPILVTNRWLGDSGVIPLLSQALVDTLVAIRVLLRNIKSNRSVCDGCLLYLYNRVRVLASIVDGASLLNDENRESFCEEGYSAELGGCLIVGLLYILHKLLSLRKTMDGLWGEIGHEVLRTLMSLSHENTTAARELSADIGVKRSTTNGIEVLARVLYFAATETCPNEAEKLKYDVVIHSLNTLTNVIECGIKGELLASVTVPGGKGSEGRDQLFLPWLVHWLVEQTSSFREALVNSTFGTSPTKHEGRRLEGKEGEQLVTSGNGFVLLAYLMSEEVDQASGRPTIRDTILAGLPGPDVKSKIAFLTNTLTAFCNFYHLSVGDLSVAVVEPVKKLIHQLEKVTKELTEVKQD